MLTSKTTRTFYDPAINTSIPDDAVEIPAAHYFELLAGESAGKLIDWDEDGFPFLKDRPAPDRSALEGDAWTNIKAERDSRTQLGGFQAQGNWFHSDTFSRSQWLGLKDQARDILAAGGAMTDPIKKLGAQVIWKTMGGTFVAVTVQLAFDVVDAVGNSDALVFKQAEVHRAAMRASADPASYDFSGGWPANFEG